ncbi:MAG: hypothetical protein PHH01_03295 [Patescibacteria group bacterium]|nr:hypothetical protein [Patescibacteria group bacterium]
MTLSPRTKKIIFISLVVVVTGLLAYGVYFLFFQQLITPENENKNANGNVNGGTLPNTNVNRLVNRNTNVSTNGATNLPQISDIANGGLTKVTDVADVAVEAGAPTSDRTGYVYYDSATHKFYQILANGERAELSDKEFYDVANVAWSPDRNQAIMDYPDGSKIYYNFKSGQTVTLPKELNDVHFSEAGDKIAYEFLGEEENERWLAIANPDGSGQQILEPLGDRDNRVEVNMSPDAQVVGIYREGIGVDQEEIYFLGQHGENFKSMVVDGAGFEGQWTPQGDKLLYSVYNSESDYKPELYIVDARGENIGLNKLDLDLNTWSDKCAFSGSSLYCAVPNDLPTGAGLDPSLASQTTDSFYQVNLETGQKSLLAIPYSGSSQIGYSAEGVYLSLDGSYLYFRNALTGKLDKIQIK